MLKAIDYLLGRTKRPATSDGTTCTKRRTNGSFLRLACILLAIFLFVTTALVTTLAMLGVMKTIYVWALLTSDINEEKAGIENKQHTSSNVQKLNKSLDKETMYSSLCLILAGFGFQLCCAAAVLLYGLFLDKIQAIYAWIIFSCTNICAFSLLIFLLDRFTSMPVDTNQMDFCLEGFAACTIAYNLLLYYYTKAIVKKEQKIIVKAYGGYTHTVTPVEKQAEKIQHMNDHFTV